MRAIENMVANVNGLSILLIPKNANSSIRWAMLDHLGVKPQEESRYHPALNACGPDQASDGTIAFIRHPFDRAASAWADKIRGRADAQKGLGVRNMKKAGFRIGSGFAAFVRDLESLYMEDVHTMPQSEFIRSGMILHKFGDLPAVWKGLMLQYPWLAPLGHDRKTGAAPHFGKNTRRILGDIYAEDLKLWQSL